jgi:FtsP/CotA-like multicopper oxidase with cupredoxin domain
MKILNRTIQSYWILTVMAAAFLMPALGTQQAQAGIDGIQVAGGATLHFTAKAGEVSTADGGAIHFYGYQEDNNLGGLPAGALPQYPGPTLIIYQNSEVTIELTSELPFGQRASIIFPGQSVLATGGSIGLVTQESTGAADTVSYTFTASNPGTYTYYSGTQTELQVEMGLVGTIIVRPTGQPTWAYNDAGTSFDHENLFLLSSMDPLIHEKAEMGLFNEIDLTKRWPVYWFINGRAAPDDLVGANVAWLPHQPYNSTPRMTPGQRMLVRMVGGDQDQHPLHLHGNHYREIARYGRLLKTNGGGLGSRQRFTTLSVPGQTVDAIFEWTGEKLGWDIYGGTDVWPEMAHNCIDVDPADGYADADSDNPMEYCADHSKPLPVVLPEKQDMAFGGWWSGSPYMGNIEPLPPGEGGLNPNGGFFFMWHSHTEKELTNFDIFPGGMLSMMVVEPPGTPIP